MSWQSPPWFLGILLFAVAGIGIAQPASAEPRGLSMDVSEKIDDRTGGLYPEIEEAATAALQAIARRRSLRYQQLGAKGIIIRTEGGGGVRVHFDQRRNGAVEPALDDIVFSSQDWSAPEKRQEGLSRLRDMICGTSYSSFEEPKLVWIRYLATLPLLAACAAVVIASVLTARKRLAEGLRNTYNRRALRKQHRAQEDSARRTAGRGYEAWKGG